MSRIIDWEIHVEFKIPKKRKRKTKGAGQYVWLVTAKKSNVFRFCFLIKNKHNSILSLLQTNNWKLKLPNAPLKNHILFKIADSNSLVILLDEEGRSTPFFLLNIYAIKSMQIMRSNM